MKKLKNLLAGLAATLVVGLVTVPMNVQAAGNIPDKLVGTYQQPEGSQTVTVTKDSISISGVVPESGDLVEVLVNDSQTVSGVTAEAAIKYSMSFQDGTKEGYDYFVLSLLAGDENTLLITRYTRSAEWVLDGLALKLQWGSWVKEGTYGYQRQGVAAAVEEPSSEAEQKEEQPKEEQPKEEQLKEESNSQTVNQPAAETKVQTATASTPQETKKYSAYRYEGENAEELVKELVKYIKTAESGSVIEFTGKPGMSCYSEYILDKLAERGDVSLKTDFQYDGNSYSFTIPAGSDYSNMEQADYYGFLYLKDAFANS